MSMNAFTALMLVAIYAALVGGLYDRFLWKGGKVFWWSISFGAAFALFIRFTIGVIEIFTKGA